jgi:hypothetical protein
LGTDHDLDVAIEDRVKRWLRGSLGFAARCHAECEQAGQYSIARQVEFLSKENTPPGVNRLVEGTIGLAITS